MRHQYTGRCCKHERPPKHMLTTWIRNNKSIISKMIVGACIVGTISGYIKLVNLQRENNILKDQLEYTQDLIISRLQMNHSNVYDIIIKYNNPIFNKSGNKKITPPNNNIRNISAITRLGSTKTHQTIFNYIITSNKNIKHNDANYMVNCIISAGKQFSVNPFIITGLIKTESNFNQYAKSNAGAIGIMQVHWPSHKKSLPKTFKNIKTKNDLYEIKNAIEAGVWLYSCALKQYNSHDKALNRYLGTNSTAYRNKVYNVANKLKYASL